MNPIWGWNYKAFCVVFKEIYAAAKTISATAGPTGPAKYQLCLSPLYDGLDHTNHTFSESSWSKDIKTYITKCLISKYTNTNTRIHKYKNTQIHKYTNTAYDKVPESPNMLYIFEKECSRISKMMFPWIKHKNTKIQIHKHTNTQIQHLTKYQKDPTCCIFLKRGLFQDIKNDIPLGVIHKLRNHFWGSR